jgi:hypothetical protein
MSLYYDVLIPARSAVEQASKEARQKLEEAKKDLTLGPASVGLLNRVIAELSTAEKALQKALCDCPDTLR